MCLKLCVPSLPIPEMRMVIHYHEGDDDEGDEESGADNKIRAYAENGELFADRSADPCNSHQFRAIYAQWKRLQWYDKQSG